MKKLIFLITLMIGISPTAFALSKGMNFFLNNFSNASTEKISVSGVNDGDWEDTRTTPSTTLNDLTLVKGTQISKRYELSRTWLNVVSDGRFTLDITMPSGEVLKPTIIMNDTPNDWKMLYTGKDYDVIGYRYNDDVFVSLINHVDLANWMSKLPDNIDIAKINMAGTHDTATSYFRQEMSLIPAFGVRTQYEHATYYRQLEDGIRFFDLRVHLEGNRFKMYHGDASLGHDFKLVLDDIKSFFKDHRNETIIMSFKNDGAYSDQFKQVFESYAYHNEGLFLDLSKKKNITLKEARGKIVLVNRAYEENGFNLGLDFSEWGDNVPTQYVDKANKYAYAIQDAYGWFGVDKANAILNFTAQYPQPLDNTFRLNFVSASTSSCFYNPSECAFGNLFIAGFQPMVYEGINKNIENAKLRNAPTGVMLLDFYSTEFIRFLNSTNMNIQ